MTADGDQDLSGFSMMDLFRTEAETQTAILNEGLLEIEKDPTSRQWLERLMRAAHSLKGAARSVNLARPSRPSARRNRNGNCESMCS